MTPTVLEQISKNKFRRIAYWYGQQLFKPIEWTGVRGGGGAGFIIIYGKGGRRFREMRHATSFTPLVTSP